MLENNFTKRDFPVLHIKPVDQMESMTNSMFSCSALTFSGLRKKKLIFSFQISETQSTSPAVPAITQTDFGCCSPHEEFYH